ncbi:MAG TPA: Gfo/Idh/MocA family oxidoreductase [Verrucomicrobiae bacterium]
MKGRSTSASKISFGVIGAGGIARRKTIPGMLRAKNCRLVAVMDPVQVNEIAAHFGIKRAYTRDTDLLADPEVEAVYIASPVGCHARQIRLAAAAGKHVLCEKPLTLNLREGQAAVAACRKHGVFLQEGYMMKFHGAHQRIKELNDTGRLGRLVYLRAQLSCWYPPMKGAWRQNPKLGGGGALIDMATHLYDLLGYFAGPIKRLTALTNRLVHPYRSEDASTTLLEFKSGAHATVDCFFCIPDEASRTRLEIYGSQGAILTEGTIGQGSGGTMEAIFGLGDAAYDAKQNKDLKRRFEKIPFPKINPYTAECEYFADCIQHGDPPALNSPENALSILKWTEQAYAGTC